MNRTELISKIKIGDRFYHNNPGIELGAVIPDYLIITDIGESNQNGYFLIQAKYENHAAYTKERLFSDIILLQSDLNPECEKPDWIFKKPSQELHLT